MPTNKELERRIDELEADFRAYRAEVAAEFEVLATQVLTKLDELLSEADRVTRTGRRVARAIRNEE